MVHVTERAEVEIRQRISVHDEELLVSRIAAIHEERQRVTGTSGRPEERAFPGVPHTGPEVAAIPQLAANRRRTVVQVQHEIVDAPADEPRYGAPDE